MFVAKKISKRTIITAGAILALVLLIVIRAAACSKTPDTAVASTGPYSLLASDNRERIAFLKQFGRKRAGRNRPGAHPAEIQ